MFCATLTFVKLMRLSKRYFIHTVEANSSGEILEIGSHFPRRRFEGANDSYQSLVKAEKSVSDAYQSFNHPQEKDKRKERS